MKTHISRGALDDLAREGFSVHPEVGDHTHIGDRHLTVIRIDISLNEPHGRTVVVTAGDHTALRQLPVEELQAQALVEEFHQAGVLHASEHFKRTLAHLLTRLSEVAERAGIETAVLDPIHLAEGGYCIDSASITYQSTPPVPGKDFQLQQGRDHVVRSPRYHERRPR